ncbi:hypothetical protein [Azotobacter chroococcum]|uniref:hypothetical protein n=1 Tax=Azotobacter chroococcum TaxID=353 RepID=UPI0005856592|nr:hypothetical protein [Azotobacter chroococcum]ASL26214.1 hypothetical protein ACG10_07755 [Azotobacter chroococcum]TBW02752.1 hypothetical protein E0E52_17205 [Azotobacter chroococcum]TKD40303.1 hypothetical protein FCG41_10345 [Azotobacter chroococcum]
MEIATEHRGMTTRCPRTALAWCKAGGSIRIATTGATTAMCRADYWRHIKAIASLEARQAA